MGCICRSSGRPHDDDVSGPMMVIAVRATAWASPAAALLCIFERFHRAANVIGHIQDTGIGLTNARQIVEQHGGAIAVESQEGAGLIFMVRLPLAES